MLKKVRKGVLFILHYFGFYPEQLVTNLAGIPWVWSDYTKLKKQNKKTGGSVKFGVPIPYFKDKNDTSGNLSGHYFHQDLVVAQKIFKNTPVKHVDIGSRTDGFVTHVASYRNIEVLDIRESSAQVPNITFIQADLMSNDKKWIDYTDSVSCLHVIEHFGLGRYGDSIDIDGHWKGLNNIHKLLKPSGKFYFSTPIGPEKIHFNAHRVFNLSTLRDYFLDLYTIDDFSYVDDHGTHHAPVKITDGLSNNFNCRFGCGIFELTKK
ncbi:MAG: SAM-dependent methyltransferase [Marinoscillum sp.]|jgi:SAM-dependent methyltransferase